uniref:Aspartyl proteinase n=1 Tax=Ganoderma boninense TaxID=34458 RepID=A0A5K1JXP9_9APHY|nr:Aspartyl proteinase [Ganoderma boninense]
MAEEPYDTYIDFGFDDDEATYFSPPTESQDLPPFLVEILAALNPESTSSLVEAPTANASTFRSPQTPAAPFVSYAQNILPFYYPITAPSSSLRGSISEYGPSTCVCPSDTIYVPGFHAAAPPAPPVPAFHVPPAYQLPNPYARVPSALPQPMSTKRPREHTEHHALHEHSSPRKRQRTAPPGSSAPDIGYTANIVANAPPFPTVTAAEAASGGPGAGPCPIPSRDWGILPGPESGIVAGPSIVEIENVSLPRKLPKRTRKENGDEPTTSKKRHKKKALVDAPEVLNESVTPYSGLRFVDCEPLPGHYPELTPEFYDELSNIASEIAQELRQASGRLTSSPAGDLS